VQQLDFDDAGVVLVDPELRCAGEHAVAFDAGDHFLAYRNVDRKHPWAAVGSATNHGLPAESPRVHNRLHVVKAGDGFDRFHSNDLRVGEHAAHLFDAFALGGFDGDELLQLNGRLGETGNELAEPVVGEFHGGLELLQKAQVAALQLADIVNAVTHHGQPC